MSDRKHNLLIGQLLKNAGLISSEQLNQALNFQSQYTKMKLGEILVLQEIIQAQTISFFVNNWQEIVQEGQQFPLGYYLKQAFLLSENQIKTILKEQEITPLKFGDLAVRKGWIGQNTLEFFLDGLSSSPPQLMSLIALEEYNHKILNLERKYVEPSLILSRVLAWTGGNPRLTKSICNIFATSDLNIPGGMEIKTVDKLIESSLIKNWQTSKLGAYLRSIKESLINNQRCNSILLLQEYQSILLSGGKAYQNSKEQKELLNLGLVVTEREQLRVTNLIYQQVFSQSWIATTIKSLESTIEENQKAQENSIVKVNTIIKSQEQKQTPPRELSLDKLPIQNSQPENLKATEPLTKYSSILTFAGVFLLIPLILAINNYYSVGKKSRLVRDPVSEASKIEQFCNEIDLSQPTSPVSLLSQLEKSKKVLLRSFPRNLEAFPHNCEVALNRLRILATPQLGKEHRVIEAIKNLCKIPADSDNINEAKVWLEHWYTSASWGKETKSYLSLVKDCPAGDRYQ